MELSDETSAEANPKELKYGAVGLGPLPNSPLRCIAVATQRPTLSHQRKPSDLAILGSLLYQRYRRLGRVDDLHKSIDALQEAVSSTLAGDTHLAARLDGLANSLHARFLQLGSGTDDLQRAISAQTRAVELTSANDYDVSYLNNLAQTLWARLEHVDELEAHTAPWIHAVKALPDGYSEKPSHLSELGRSLWRRFVRHGCLQDLEDAIANHANAVELTPDGHPDKPSRLSHLGSSLYTRFQHYGRLPDLEDAIIHEVYALDLTPNGHPDKPLRLGNLGSSLYTRFEHHGHVQDLEDAITHLVCGIELIPDGHPDKPFRLGSLGSSLHARFEHHGRLQDLEDAISHKVHALELTPDGHSDKPPRLGNLGSSLHARFHHHGRLQDLEDAIANHMNAVELTPDGHPDKPSRLGNLGSSLWARFLHYGRPQDLKNAITHEVHALELTPNGHPDKSLRLANLGSSLLARFEHHGNSQDLEDAIKHEAHALELTPDGHPDKPSRLCNLGSSLHARFERHGCLQDLEAAIAHKVLAVELTPDRHPDKTLWLWHFGRLLQKRFEHKLNLSEQVGSIAALDTDDCHRAVRAYLAAVRNTSGPTSSRFKAATACTQLLLCHRSLTSSELLIEAHGYLIDLIPQMAWLGHNLNRRYEELAKLGSLVNEAASAAIAVGQHVRALEWLESGRAVVWAQLLHLNAPLDELRKDYSQLAAEFEDASQALRHANSIKNASTAVLPNSLNSRVHSPYSHVIRYDNIVESIRAKDGFEDFLRPKKLLQLSSTCSSGPVVMINVQKSRCDVLILRHPGAIVHVPLPDLSLTDAQRLRDQLRSVLIKTRHLPTRFPSGTYRTNDKTKLTSAEVPFTGSRYLTAQVCDILGELWYRVVKPIIDVLLAYSSLDGDLLHITWCPTGPLAFLPLHAAGDYRKQKLTENVMEFAISSYTPSLESLLRRHITVPADLRRHSDLLIVSQPATPGCGDLPRTVEEAGIVQGIFPDSSLLNDSQGTIDAVLEGMKTHHWIHLACHGLQNTADPTQSSFFLHDGKLTLSTLISASFPHAELAFLSACQTATGVEKLPEESVHLAAGMLNIGYKSVIGTMWSIADDDGPIVARRFYDVVKEQIAGKGELRAAYALHEATKQLRNEVGLKEYLAWVPFVHFGI